MIAMIPQFLIHCTLLSVFLRCYHSCFSQWMLMLKWSVILAKLIVKETINPEHFFKVNVILFGLEQTVIGRALHIPNPQVAIAYSWRPFSQHSFRLRLRMNGMHRSLSEHVSLDLLSREIYAKHIAGARIFAAISLALNNLFVYCWIVIVTLVVQIGE